MLNSIAMAFDLQTNSHGFGDVSGDCNSNIFIGAGGNARIEILLSSLSGVWQGLHCGKIRGA